MRFQTRQVRAAVRRRPRAKIPAAPPDAAASAAASRCSFMAARRKRLDAFWRVESDQPGPDYPSRFLASQNAGKRPWKASAAVGQGVAPSRKPWQPLTSSGSGRRRSPKRTRAAPGQPMSPAGRERPRPDAMLSSGSQPTRLHGSPQEALGRVLARRIRSTRPDIPPAFSRFPERKETALEGQPAGRSVRASASRGIPRQVIRISRAGVQG